MQPISRAAAAVEILDNYLLFGHIELALQSWFKKNRFAGSSDRREIRDIIFDILRNRRSLFYPFEANSIEESGQILTISYLSEIFDPKSLFEKIQNNKYFKSDISPKCVEILQKKSSLLKAAPSPIILDFPDFLEARLRTDLKHNFEPILKRFKKRAPTFLRVNKLKTSIQKVQVLLGEEGVLCRPFLHSNIALEVIDGNKLIKTSRCFKNGLIEIQDFSSQMITETSMIRKGLRILDYCAGGGGKTLAVASRVMNKAEILAFDISEDRLSRLPLRASRAGATIRLLNSRSLKDYFQKCDVVIVDAPCSGSGVWRRNPTFKWELTEQKLRDYLEKQTEILSAASEFVSLEGVILYSVCSLISEEGIKPVRNFMAQSNKYRIIDQVILNPLNASDGFYSIVLKRKKV